MTFTKEEKRIASQVFFDRCFAIYNTFSISGITDFYTLINDGERCFYIDKQDEKIKDYACLRLFHCIDFNDFPETIKIKIIKSTKDIFEGFGYIVTEKNLPSK